MVNKDEVKDRVLTENTAQGILNHLRELSANRKRTQKRWVWELLQNSLDSASEEDYHLIASVKLRNGELVFQHNGRGFTMDEVAHLIYHGSTKLEDENTIGQYGSGFLTTHLLSPAIDVAGQLDDGRPFKFSLNREIVSAAALSLSMDRAWNEFDETSESVVDGFTTEFRYPLSNDSASAVEEGIKTLRQCAPFVVVFNPEFHSINIESLGETTIFEVDKRVSLAPGLHTVTVRVSENGSSKDQKYLLAEGQHAAVTIPIAAIDSGVSCLPLEGIPRLFLGFPLVGTEAFSFPAVINSRRFTPTEDRDGVFLGQSDDEANKRNQRAVTEACELHLQLIAYVTESQWANTYTLATLPAISEQTWMNKDWILDTLTNFVERVRQTPAVICSDSKLASAESIVPLAKNPDGTHALWDLLSGISVFRQRLPARHEAAGWREAVRSWAVTSDVDAPSFDEGYDGRKLLLFLESASKEDDTTDRTIERFARALEDDIDATTWLNRLYDYLQDDGFDQLIRERRIVLNQAGCLDFLSNLFRDNDISEELKAVADDVLDMGIRGTLRDNRLTSLVDEAGKGDQRDRDVVQILIDKLEELCSGETIGGKFAQASPRLLSWLVANEQWSHLTRFPAFSIMPENGTREVLWLGKIPGDDADVPFAPKNAWVENLQQYADLFPWRCIMAESFFAEMPTPAVWQLLSAQGYVRTDVVIKTCKPCGDFLPDEPLADGDHRTIDSVSLTDLAFLARDRTGIMARVRDSQPRAQLFWSFLTEWLVTRDPEGLEPLVADCECGSSHRYYPATWLVPVVKNRWVPQGNDIRDSVSAQSLATLLRGGGWTPDGLGGNPTALKLLEAMRVTRFDLMRYFVVNDEEARTELDDTMTNILVSTGGDLTYVRDFVEDMKIDTDLPNHLAERRERRRMVKQNQHLGSLVEDLVAEALRDEGFTVRRTGIGSDFEIEYDMVEHGEEVGIELSKNDRTWLVEVKATREQRVRMTATQAKTAVDRGDEFLLCVVPAIANLDRNDIRGRMRFVKNIGQRVEPLCAELDELNELQDVATSPSNSDIQLEIQSGTARIRVDNAAWQNGVNLNDLATSIT